MNLAILFVVGYYVLGLSGKRKYSQIGDVLPRYTRQRDKAEIEKESKEIIEKELNLDHDFEKVQSHGATGFLYYYLYWTKNDETLTTTAKFEIVKTLSENDLPWDLELFLSSF